MQRKSRSKPTSSPPKCHLRKDEFTDHIIQCVQQSRDGMVDEQHDLMMKINGKK